MAVHRDGNIGWSDKASAEEQLADIFDERQKMEEAAYKWIAQEQWELADGRKHHFMVPSPYGDQTLMIYGWTWDWELEKSKWEQLPPGSEDRMESEYEYETYTDSLKRGYAFTRSFSVIEPDGELGSHHISTMCPIDQAQFERAREHKWIPSQEDTVVLNQFIERYRVFMESKEEG